jgi:hypothetical protein
MILAKVTGYPIPPFRFCPPRAVCTISLLMPAIAVSVFYLFHLAGAWRWIFVVTVVTALAQSR